mmetsp:Transcript_77887/g.226025  ORF Transcript_77887/g.226025 Transcript_77887/m.226025 type:complete len:243 (+) Transcript_77887:776-1504(+)
MVGMTSKFLITFSASTLRRRCSSKSSELPDVVAQSPPRILLLIAATSDCMLSTTKLAARCMSSLSRIGISSMAAMALFRRPPDTQPSDIFCAEACIFDCSCVFVSLSLGVPGMWLELRWRSSGDCGNLAQVTSALWPNLLHTRESGSRWSHVTVHPSGLVSVFGGPLSRKSYAEPKRLPLYNVRPPSSTVHTLPRMGPSSTRHFPVTEASTLSRRAAGEEEEDASASTATLQAPAVLLVARW